MLKHNLLRRVDCCSYDVYLKDDIDDPSSPLRVGLISSAIERDIDILSSFRNDLMSNGAGEEDY